MSLPLTGLFPDFICSFNNAFALQASHHFSVILLAAAGCHAYSKYRSQNSSNHHYSLQVLTPPLFLPCFLNVITKLHTVQHLCDRWSFFVISGRRRLFFCINQVRNAIKVSLMFRADKNAGNLRRLPAICLFIH